MDGQLTLVLVISAALIAPFVIFAVIRYARTNYIGVYKRLKKPVRTTGVIEWVECVALPRHSGSYYIITYSYTDNAGERRTAAFRWHKKIGWPGDSIELHFDSQDPESCIAECQVEYGKKELKYTVIVISAIIVFTVFSLAFSQ